MIAQILAGETEIEPDGSGSVTLRGALQQGGGRGVVAILPCQPSEPRHRFGVLRHDVQDRPPSLARLWPQNRLVERSRLLEKGLPPRRDRDSAIEMREGGFEIPVGAGDPRGEQMRGGMVGPFGKAGLDMGAGRLNLALRKQHGGQEMVEHGLAGLAAQTLFAEFARLVRLAGIEGCSSAADDVLGGGFRHAGHIRTKGRGCNRLSSSAKADDPVRRGLSISTEAGDYWMRPLRGA